MRRQLSREVAGGPAAMTGSSPVDLVKRNILPALGPHLFALVDVPLYRAPFRRAGFDIATRPRLAGDLMSEFALDMPDLYSCRPGEVKKRVDVLMILQIAAAISNV
jgi:hypothetical protein